MMKFLRDKLILTDADGVLLDWRYAFLNYMRTLGITSKDDAKVYNLSQHFDMPEDMIMAYVKQFNTSSYMGSIPPLNDAIHYVRKLHEEHGYIFHAITACTDDSHAAWSRAENLKNLFGNTAFEQITTLPLGDDKRDALKQYKDTGCVWVEDSPNHVETGLEFGLDVYLMRHDYNDHVEEQFEKEGVKIVHSWKEIHSLLT